MDVGVETEVNVLSLPWVVGSEEGLALTTIRPQSLSPRISPSPEVPGLELNDSRLRGLLEGHTGDSSYEGVEIEPLCATHAGQVVARVKKEDLDVVATVGHIQGSPADPDSWRLKGLVHPIQPREETILKQGVNWYRELDQTGSTDLDSWGAARRATERTLEEYDRKSNLGSVLSSLGEEENFEPVANPPTKVKVMAERGIVPALYQEMEEYARPRVVEYSVATGNPNIWRTEIVAEPAVATVPEDPPHRFSSRWASCWPAVEPIYSRL